MPTQLNDTNFKQTLTGQWLVMFSAPWAGPCNLVRPAFEEAAGRFGNSINFGEFVLDDNPDTPEKYGVRQVPLFMMFEDGKPTAVKVGAVPVEDILEMCA